MPDSITPVGTQNKYDPMQGINMLSGVLGIQHQQVGLQQQQQELRSQTAQADQATQRNQELQRAQSLAVDAVKSGKYMAPDGSLDRQRLANDISQIGPYAQENAGSLLSQANEVVANQRAHQALTVDRKKEMGDTFKSLAAKPDLTNSDFIDAIETLRQQHPNDPEFSRMLTSMSTHMPGTADSKTLQNLAGRWASASTGESQIGQTSNAAGQIVNRNVMTGDISMPGAGGSVNPTSSTVAGNTSLSTGASEGDISRANEVGAKTQAASSAVRLSKQVDALAKAINSGGAAKDVSATLQYLGFGSLAEARTQLQKDLGQLRGAVASRAGSDQRANEILEGYPTDTTPENTIHYAMDYIRGSARQDLARSNLLQTHGRAGFQMADNALVGQTDPLMHEFMALKPEERAGFYRRNFKSAQEAQAFKDSVMAHQKRTQSGVQNGP